MSHVIYVYIEKPTTAQVGNFLRSLNGHGISISHLGKNDPPRKFDGSVDEAVNMAFCGRDLTDYTFARDAARKLGFSIQIHHDPRWTHSTVSASCPDTSVLDFVVDSAVASFDFFIAVRGTLDIGKEQHWNILHVTERCPHELRSKFIAA